MGTAESGNGLSGNGLSGNGRSGNGLSGNCERARVRGSTCGHPCAYKVLEVPIDKGMKHGQKIVFSGEADEQVDRSPPPLWAASARAVLRVAAPWTRCSTAVRSRVSQVSVVLCSRASRRATSSS